MSAQKLPIGVQSFQSLRESGYLYVDKTPYIEQLLRGKVAGINAVGVFAQGGEPFAFAAQAFRQRGVAAEQRMAAAGFGKAAQQHSFAGF